MLALTATPALAAEPPTIKNTSYSDPTTTCVTLKTEINAGGLATTYHFEYLTEAQFTEDHESFGAGTEKTPELTDPSAEEGPFHPLSAELCGLTHSTNYHFRAVATNSQSPPGGTLGTPATFITLNGPSHELTATFGDARPTTATAPTNLRDPYPLSGPTDVAVDQSTGDLYVTDPANHRVEKFSPTGEFLLMFGQEVNKNGSDVCTAAEECQPGVPAPETEPCASRGNGTSCVDVTDVDPGQFDTPTYLAVDNSHGPSSGDVYVADTGTGLVQKFDSSGRIVSSWGDGEGKGQEDGRDATDLPFFGALGGVAVDSEGRLYVYGFDYSTDVWEYQQTGAYIGWRPRHVPVFPSQGPTTEGTPLSISSLIAFDPSDREYYQSTGAAIDHYGASCDFATEETTNESCQPIDVFGAGQLTGAEGIGLKTATHTVYVADPGADEVDAFSDIRPQVTTAPPTKLTETTITFAGHVDPEAEGIDHGEITGCRFEWGLTTAYGHTVPCAQSTPYSTAESVTATITGLTPIVDYPIGTKYHYRLLAENVKGATGEGHDETTVTTAVPKIEGVSSSHLTATSAQLDATISPNGLPTKYHFEYGTTTAYGESTPEFEVEGDESQLLELHRVAVPIDGLQRGVTYHFRLLAENELDAGHPVASEDQNFEFFPPACPNSAVRQQTGSAYLPDCRAYELVSPANANATLLYPGGPNAGQATSPSRFSYTGQYSSLPGTDTIETGGDLYLATRTDTGWVSRYIGLPGNEAGCMGGPPTDQTSKDDNYSPPWLTDTVLANPSMSEVLNWEEGDPINCTGLGFQDADYNLSPASTAPYLWSSEGALQRRLPTDFDSLPAAEAALQCPNTGISVGGWICESESTASPDLTHLLFSSNQMDFAEGSEAGQGLTVAPGSAYDDDLATGRVQLISKLSNGNPIPQDPSFATAPRLESAHEIIPGGAEEFIRFPAVSTDGSHVLISTATGYTGCGQGFRYRCPRPSELPLHLYMRVNDAVTYEIAEDKATGEPAVVNYVGMTPDGSKVFFTSEQHLTGEDTEHAGPSLYMWSAEKAAEEKEPLTLLSKAAPGSPPGAGDSAECQPALAKVYRNAFEEGGGPNTVHPYPLTPEAPWTSGCGVRAIDVYPYSAFRAGAGGNGISDSAVAADGDIYFYSPEQLDGDRGVPGQENLYDYREGQPRYVTTLDPERTCIETSQREACTEGPIVRIEVSPDDSHMAFLTRSRLTSYDNAGYLEMYSYTPSTETLICDSCNPDGNPATGNAEASQDGLFLTDDGRTFFSTEESLVPTDTNEGEDVYEYVDGRPQLITPGTEPAKRSAPSIASGAETAGLVGVSANGTDVYFSTFATLVSEDRNGDFLKFYDARTDGGFPQPPPVQPCAAAEECHGPGTEAPTLPTQGTAATLAGGNAIPETHSKHHKKHKRKSKRHHKRAGHKRGGKK